MLAADSVKRRLPFGPWHRLAYNGFAVVHLAAIWWLGQSLLADAPPLGLSATLGWTGNALTIAGLGIIAVALLGYDRGGFWAHRRSAAPTRQKTNRCGSIDCTGMSGIRFIAVCF